MTPGDAREQLEAAIWRTDPPSLYAVGTILAAADAYALAHTSEALDQLERDRRIAARQAALIAGDGKHYRSTACPPA